ncbi:MAG: serine/threonine protein kinase [Bifidobacteriaceae bacterium]|jgi:predicted Ser/Thr protein kinase|nr:serine/threonine protein kinase [Bifidobacteriaceae bacterium]
MEMNYDKLCLGCFREIAAPPCPHCGFDPADATSYPLALRPGEILAGRYLVGRPLGQGGFGITYLAFDLTLQIKVAVKEYMPAGLIAREGDRTSVVLLSDRHESDFQANKQKFLDEARILAQLSDTPNIVTVQNFFLENNTAYFTMEYVDGMSLKDVVAGAGGRLGFDQTARFLEPIAAALAQVHARALLHRDISPDNVVITATGQSKLLDFGAARFALGDERSLSVILKHGFAPEEQYRTHGRQGPWTDLYALAATFYYCLTGSRPPDAIDRLHQDTLVPPSALGVALPAYAEAALMRALAVRAEQRYQSMGQFVAGLAGREVPAPTAGTGPTDALGGSGTVPASAYPSGGGAGRRVAAGTGAGDGPGIGGPGASGRPEPSGAQSLWKRLTGSRRALIATGIGAALVLAGIVTAVALEASGGGEHNAVGGAGGGRTVPTTDAPLIPPTSDPTLTGEVPPTPDPTDTPIAEEPPPTEEPPTPDPLRTGEEVPGNWFASTQQGVGFEIPSGWTAGDTEDGVMLASSDQTAFGVIVHEVGYDTAYVSENRDEVLYNFTQGIDIATRWEFIAEDTRTDLGPLTWYQLSFALYDEEASLYPVQMYVTDAPQGGSFQVCFVSSPASDGSLYPDMDSVLTSFAPGTPADSD